MDVVTFRSQPSSSTRWNRDVGQFCVGHPYALPRARCPIAAFHARPRPVHQSQMLSVLRPTYEPFQSVHHSVRPFPGSDVALSVIRGQRSIRYRPSPSRRPDLRPLMLRCGRSFHVNRYGDETESRGSLYPHRYVIVQSRVFRCRSPVSPIASVIRAMV